MAAQFESHTPSQPPRFRTHLSCTDKNAFLAGDLAVSMVGVQRVRASRLVVGRRGGSTGDAPERETFSACDTMPEEQLHDS